MKDEIREPGAAADRPAHFSSFSLQTSSFNLSSIPWLIALMLMAALAVLLPELKGRSVVDFPWVMDLGYQWAPFSDFVRRCYRAGLFPLWDPYDLCGTPFLAFAHTGSLYLPAVAAQLVGGAFQPGAALDIFLHLTLTVVATFALFREAGRSATASFCASSVFAFSGYYLSNLSFLPSLHTGAWLMVWYAGAFSLLKRPRFWPFALTSAAFAAMVLAGDLELIMFGVLGLGLEVYLRHRGNSLIRGAAPAFLGSLMIGAAIAAPQLLPAAELQHFSVRSGGSLAPSLEWYTILAPFGLALFQVPLPGSLLPANHGLDPWYLGAFLMLLAASGLRRHGYVRRRLLSFPAVAAYLVLIYAAPFRPFTCHIPILGSTLVPQRVWPVLEIFFLLAVTFELDQWMVEASPAVSPAEQEKDAGPGRVLPLGHWGAGFLILFAALTALSLIWVRHGLATRLMFCAVLAGAGLGAWIRHPLLTRPRARPALAVLLVLADLYLLCLSWLPMSPKEDFRIDPRLASILSFTAASERYAIISITGIVDPTLPFHLGLRLDAATIDSFSRLPPRSMADRLGRLYPSLARYRGGLLLKYDQMVVRDPKQLDPARLDLLNRMNVAWIVSRYPWQPDGPGLELSPKLADPDLYLYWNAAALPRAYEENGGRVEPRSVSYPAPDRVEVEEGSNVTLSDSWYPGWHAFAGGREIRLGVDDLAFRTFSSRAGSPVDMRFTPASFHIGLFTGLSALIGLFLTALLRLIFSRSRRSISGGE